MELMIHSVIIWIAVSSLLIALIAVIATLTTNYFRKVQKRRFSFREYTIHTTEAALKGVRYENPGQPPVILIHFVKIFLVVAVS